jgi:hypothetical protein
LAVYFMQWNTDTYAKPRWCNQEKSCYTDGVFYYRKQPKISIYRDI